MHTSDSAEYPCSKSISKTVNTRLLNPVSSKLLILWTASTSAPLSRPFTVLFSIYAIQTIDSGIEYRGWNQLAGCAHTQRFKYQIDNWVVPLLKSDFQIDFYTTLVRNITTQRN